MRDKSLKQRMNEGEVLVGVGIPMKTDPKPPGLDITGGRL